MNILKKRYAFGVDIVADGEVTDKHCGIMLVWFWVSPSAAWRDIVDIYSSRYKGNGASVGVIFNHFNRV